MTNKNNINFDNRFKKTKDVREISYYVENGVQPFKLEGWKGLLYAYFWTSDVHDLSENWFIANEEYTQQRRDHAMQKNQQESQQVHNKHNYQQNKNYQKQYNNR